MDTLIKNARFVNEGKIHEGHIHLKNGIIDHIYNIKDKLPEIKNTTEFGTWDTSSSENIFPYVSPNKTVNKFIELVYEKNVVLSFDWMKWKEGQDILEKGEGDYSEFDLMTLVKLFTTIVRNDRFCEGYLVSKFEDGTILKILRRIQSIFNV